MGLERSGQHHEKPRNPFAAAYDSTLGVLNGLMRTQVLRGLDKSRLRKNDPALAKHPDFKEGARPELDFVPLEPSADTVSPVPGKNPFAHEPKGTAIRTLTEDEQRALGGDDTK